MRRMITRLIIARMIPVAINAGKKAFRKRKSAAKARDGMGDEIDAPKLEEVKKIID